MRNEIKSLNGRYSEQFEGTMDLYLNGCHPSYQSDIDAALYGENK